jgi:hypothetical protein
MTRLESIYKKTYWCYLALNFLFFPALIFQINEIALCITVCFSFILGVITLYYSILLYNTIEGKVPLVGLFLGIIFVAGGSFSDMAVTAWCSPDLSEEGNPVLVALLNHDFSLGSIYLFTLFYQMLKVSIYLFLWASFLKAYPKMLKMIPYVNIFTTFRWLLGGAKMGFSDFLLSKNIQFDFLVPSLSFIIFSTNILHWYYVLEWLKWIPHGSDTTILALGTILVSLFFLLMVTHYQVKRDSQKNLFDFS